MNLCKYLSAIAIAAVAAAGFTSYAWTSTTAVATAAAPLTLTVDNVHSTVIFKCKHVNTSWSFGRFNQIDGKIQYDPEKPEASSIDLTIKVDSIDTNSKDRDAHLQSGDFFSVKEFPTATFKSKSVTKKGDKLSVAGDLTIKGVTKPLTLEVEPTGKIENNPHMGTAYGFYTTTTIKRSDFGINFSPDMLGDDIELWISIEAAKK